MLHLINFPSTKMNGTQLAAGLNNNDVVMIWRYPTGEILSKMEHSNSDSTMCIAWSSFDVDMLATYKWVSCQISISINDIHVKIPFVVRPLNCLKCYTFL